MKPGQVVSIRVNPKDCMAVLDTIQNTGLYVKGMSFPAMVNMVLSTCLESLRQSNTIPERTGFEYLQMMGPYLGQGRNKRAHDITNALSSNSEFQVRPVPTKVSPFMAVTPQPTNEVRSAQFVGQQYEVLDKQEISQPQKVVGARLAESVGMTIREAQTELTELCAKKDLSEEGQYVWTPALEERFQLCYKIVYPEG